MHYYPFDVELLIKTCREAGVEKLGIFGSMARGDWNTDSDIDLLVQFPAGESISLLKMVRLKNDLSEALGWKVDVVTEKGISPYTQANVMREVVFLEEK